MTIRRLEDLDSAALTYADVKPSRPATHS